VSKKLNDVLTFQDLMSDMTPRLSWMEPAIIPHSSKVLIGGQAKIGKSFLCMGIARALATGSAVFNGPSLVVPRPCKILLADKELAKWTLGKRTRSFFQTASEAELALAGQNFLAETGSPAFYFDAVDCRETLKNYLDEKQPNVLIVDPVSKFMQGSDQENDDVRRFLEFMDILIERYSKTTKMSVVMSHHFRKPQKDYRGNIIDPDSAYNFRGGSRWYDDMDTLITVQRHEVRGDEHWRCECKVQTRHGLSPANMWLDMRPDHVAPVCEMLKKPDERGLRLLG
jgi:RecA-family ATPase